MRTEEDVQQATITDHAFVRSECDPEYCGHWNSKPWGQERCNVLANAHERRDAHVVVSQPARLFVERPPRQGDLTEADVPEVTIKSGAATLPLAILRSMNHACGGCQRVFYADLNNPLPPGYEPVAGGFDALKAHINECMRKHPDYYSKIGVIADG